LLCLRERSIHPRRPGLCEGIPRRAAVPRSPVDLHRTRHRAAHSVIHRRTRAGSAQELLRQVHLRIGMPTDGLQVTSLQITSKLQAVLASARSIYVSACAAEITGARELLREYAPAG